MGIFLIIIGTILTLICGGLYASTHLAIKNQENWDDFYRQLEEKNLPVPEETVYQMVCKMNFWFCLGTIIGIMALLGGILIQVFSK